MQFSTSKPFFTLKKRIFAFLFFRFSESKFYWLSNRFHHIFIKRIFRPKMLIRKSREMEPSKHGIQRTCAFCRFPMGRIEKKEKLKVVKLNCAPEKCRQNFRGSAQNPPKSILRFRQIAENRKKRVFSNIFHI
jgi:hypothetical protein